MKHRTLTALTLAALIALTSACSSDEATSAPAPSHSVEITAEPTEDALTKEERIEAAENAPGKATPEPQSRTEPGEDPAVDAFVLAHVSASVPNADAYATDEQIFDLARSACAVLDSGTTMREYYHYMAGMEGGEEEKAVVAAIGGAVIAAYCPEHLPEVP